jgi:hypothetical protein
MDMELSFPIFSRELQHAAISHVAKKAQGLQNLSCVMPKIPSVFLPIFAVSDLVGENHFSKKKKFENFSK